MAQMDTLRFRVSFERCEAEPSKQAAYGPKLNLLSAFSACCFESLERLWRIQCTGIRLLHRATAEVLLS